MRPTSCQHERLEEEAHDFLLDQWHGIGLGGGGSAPPPLPFVVDPEALLLASSRLARDDVRLAVAALDWTRTNGRLLNASRLRGLQRASGLGDERILAAMCHRLAEEGRREAGRALRFASTAFPEARLGDLCQESAFAVHRPCRPPDAREPHCLLFAARSFVGRNARAEILASMLLAGEEGCSPARLAADTGWCPKTVRTALEEMTESGWVGGFGGDGEIRYSLEGGRWDDLLPPGSRPVWWNPLPFYGFCAGLLRVLGEVRRHFPCSHAETAERMEALMPRAMRAALAAARGRPGRIGPLLELRGEDLRLAAEAELDRFVADLRARTPLLEPGWMEG